MVKHTPGPWALHIRGKHGAVTIPESGPYVCTVEGAYRDGDSDELPLEDARLIAAAPELLEASKAILAELRRWRDNKPEQWDEMVDAGMCNAWDGIKAAIAKAEAEA